MRRLGRAVTSSTLIVGFTVATVAGAHASVAGKSVTKFCEKAAAISATVPDTSSNDALIDAARDYAKEYKKLAKLASTKAIGNAVKTIAKYYARLAKSGDPNSQAANYTAKEVAAISTVSEYVPANCPGVVPST
jgi:hypothetical protein